MNATWDCGQVSSNDFKCSSRLCNCGGMDVPESNDITATSIQSPMVLLNDLIEENAPLVTCKKKKKNILRDKKKSLKRDRDARRIMETSTDQPPTEESVLSDTITNIDNSIDEMDSGEEDHPGLIKLKPPRPPRKKVKETLKEPLYEEDIIEGFSFAAFSTYEDLEVGTRTVYRLFLFFRLSSSAYCQILVHVLHD